ncbi:hypothetical protein [Flavobacterium sp.]|uniref:hypothetical protein n=1 Tax=Flavobacterium sp. TaxID=239 RepID=UPI003753698C
MKIEHQVSEISYSTTSNIYTRIQVLTWIVSGTAMLNILEKKACDLLSNIIKENNETKPIIANFNGITDIDDHAMDSVFKSLQDNKRQLVIINGHHLLDKINKSKKDSKAELKSDSKNETITIGNSKIINYNKIIEERANFISIFIKSMIASTFKKFDNEIRLCSTPIVANGEFNSNEIISNPNKFIWLTFFLSDKLKDVLNATKLENVKLLSASLRGAPFASMLGLIHNIKFETIDHFGPKHKVFDLDFINQKEKDINYIYIGDFVVGGTEIKIAKTYTEMKGSKLCHALVLGSLFENEIFSDFELNYLVSLKDVTDGIAEFKLF